MTFRNCILWNVTHGISALDCVSFKPNSTQIVIQNLDCTGSHGISVGSLGQYQGETDIVEDLYIYNISMTDASDVARIKVWPGVPPDTSSSTSGGGLGRVRNVTYEHMQSENNDRVISVSQCYESKNQTMCDSYPVRIYKLLIGRRFNKRKKLIGLSKSKLVIEDVLFKDFTGTTSKKYDPEIGELTCSSPDVGFFAATLHCRLSYCH